MSLQARFSSSWCSAKAEGPEKVIETWVWRHVPFQARHEVKVAAQTSSVLHFYLVQPSNLTV